MPSRARCVAAALIACLLVSGPAARGADNPQSLVSQSELDDVLAQRAAHDTAARATIQALLQRAEVRELAEGYGLDMQRAEAAVATLEGGELQGLALQAAQADAQLAGGDVTVRIGLVALLLIIIIVILLVR